MRHHAPRHRRAAVQVRGKPPVKPPGHIKLAAHIGQRDLVGDLKPVKLQQHRRAFDAAGFRCAKFGLAQIKAAAPHDDLHRRVCPLPQQIDRHVQPASDSQRFKAHPLQRAATGQLDRSLGRQPCGFRLDQINLGDRPQLARHQQRPRGRGGFGPPQLRHVQLQPFQIRGNGKRRRAPLGQIQCEPPAPLARHTAGGQFDVKGIKRLLVQHDIGAHFTGGTGTAQGLRPAAIKRHTVNTTRPLNRDVAVRNHHVHFFRSKGSVLDQNIAAQVQQIAADVKDGQLGVRSFFHRKGNRAGQVSRPLGQADRLVGFVHHAQRRQVQQGQHRGD